MVGNHSYTHGAFTYLDVILVFFTATLFMAIVSESGGIPYVVRSESQNSAYSSAARAGIPFTLSTGLRARRSAAAAARAAERASGVVLSPIM